MSSHFKVEIRALTSNLAVCALHLRTVLSLLDWICSWVGPIPRLPPQTLSLHVQCIWCRMIYCKVIWVLFMLPTATLSTVSTVAFCLAREAINVVLCGCIFHKLLSLLVERQLVIKLMAWYLSVEACAEEKISTARHGPLDN